jgi:cAMP phosphodiesterase
MLHVLWVTLLQVSHIDHVTNDVVRHSVCGCNYERSICSVTALCRYLVRKLVEHCMWPDLEKEPPGRGSGAALLQNRCVLRPVAIIRRMPLCSCGPCAI